MAVWAKGQLLLLVTVVVGVYILCVSRSGVLTPWSSDEGIRSHVVAANRKLLSQSMIASPTTYFLQNDRARSLFNEGNDLVTPTTMKPPTSNDNYALGEVEESFDIDDYGPPSLNPPVHTDPPLAPPHLMSLEVENFVADYQGASASDPEVDHNMPPPHMRNFDNANAFIDYQGASASHPRVDHNMPPPELTNLDDTNAFTDYQGASASHPRVDHNTPPPHMTNLDGANAFIDYQGASASHPRVDHNLPPPHGHLTNLDVGNFATHQETPSTSSPSRDHEYGPHF